MRFVWLPWCRLSGTDASWKDKTRFLTGDVTLWPLKSSFMSTSELRAQGWSRVPVAWRPPETLDRQNRNNVFFNYSWKSLVYRYWRASMRDATIRDNTVGLPSKAKWQKLWFEEIFTWWHWWIFGSVDHINLLWKEKKVINDMPRLLKAL